MVSKLYHEVEADLKVGKCNSPSNLLDDVPDESSALAQVALGARDTGLNNARGSLLYFRKEPGPKVSRMSIVCHNRNMCYSPEGGKQSRDPPRGETGLNCAGRYFVCTSWWWCGFQRTWPLLVPTIRPERAGASFAIF